MLVDPSLDELLTKVDNKFKLVTLALKRARQINDGSAGIDGYNAAKPVSMALHEINTGEVFVGEACDEPEAPKAPAHTVDYPTDELDNILNAESADLDSDDISLSDFSLNLNDDSPFGAAPEMPAIFSEAPATDALDKALESVAQKEAQNDDEPVDLSAVLNNEVPAENN